MTLDDSREKKLPIYFQIKEFIHNKIDRGEWKTGTRIFSEAELGELFDTSRMTVNRALRELTAEGRIIRKQGQGSFVATLKPQSALLEVNSIRDEIKKNGGRHSCHVHLLTGEKASPDIARNMGILPYEPVFHSILVHMDDNIPIQVGDRYINPVVAPEYLEQDFTRITPTEYLLKLAPITGVDHVVEALIPEAWIRQLLKINESEPCLALHRTTWVKQGVATRSKFYYPGSRYSLGGRFTPINKGSIQVV